MAVFTVIFDPPSIPPMVAEAAVMDLLADPILAHAQSHLDVNVTGISIANSFLNAYSGEGLVLSHPDQPARFTINQES